MPGYGIVFQTTSMADPASLEAGCAGRPIEMYVTFGLIEIGDVIAGLLLEATAQEAFVDALRFGTTATYKY